MKINIKPIAYAVIDSSDCNKFSSVSKWCADSVLAADPSGERNRVEPLYPESLVIELAEALFAMLESAEVDFDINDKVYFKGRALLAKITDESAA